MTSNANVDLLRCVTPDGQILLIESDRVESTRKTLNSLFQRRTGNEKKNRSSKHSFHSVQVIKKSKMKPNREQSVRRTDLTSSIDFSSSSSVCFIIDQ